MVGKKRRRALFRLDKYQKGFIIPIKASAWHTPELFQAIPLHRLSPDVPARGNLFLEHRVIVSGPQRNLCVREVGEAGCFAAAAFNDASVAAGNLWKLKTRLPWSVLSYLVPVEAPLFP